MDKFSSTNEKVAAIAVLSIVDLYQHATHQGQKYIVDQLKAHKKVESMLVT